MTLQELSQYHKLLECLHRDREMLASFEAKAHPGAQALTGMPHTPGVSDKVGDLAVEIADLKDQIARLESEIEQKRGQVTQFIVSIENDQTRMIFRLRFLRCLTWGQVADVIGGRNTEVGVKTICYRYLDARGRTGEVNTNDQSGSAFQGIQGTQKPAQL